MKQKKGRHAPAFILLVLAMEPNHGLGILNRMNDLFPGNRMDTAVIYRVLKNMEEEGYISSQWEDSDSGPKKKVYHITARGKDHLNVFKLDIEKSIERLSKFVELYESLEF